MGSRAKSKSSKKKISKFKFKRGKENLRVVFRK